MGHKRRQDIRVKQLDGNLEVLCSTSACDVLSSPILEGLWLFGGCRFSLRGWVQSGPHSQKKEERKRLPLYT